MLKVGDKVVCPPHGVGIIEGKEVRKVDGREVAYFRISLVGRNMYILVPETSIASSEIRPVLTHKGVENIIKFLSEVPENVSEKWTVRHRLNLDRIRTGNVKKLATVVRNLSYRSRKKELSYSEKRMFDEAFGKLSEEIALSLDEPVKSVEKKLKKILKGVRKG